MKKCCHLLFPYIVCVIVGLIVGSGGSIFVSGFVSYLGDSVVNQVVLYVIWIIIVLSAYFMITNWRSLKPIDKAKSGVQLMSVSIASIMVVLTIVANSNNARCQKRIAFKDDLIQRIGAISSAIQLEMGIPNNCFDADGGTKDIGPFSSSVNLAYDKYRSEKRIVRDKILSEYPQGGPVYDAWNRYSDLTMQMEVFCNTKNSDYHDLYRKISEAHLQLVGTLVESISNCNNP